MLIYSNRVNNYSPFPLHDTEYVTKLEDMIDNINDYDNEPIVTCKYCHTMHIILDDEGNNVCHRCGSMNELETLSDMKEYEKKYGHLWEVVHPTVKIKKDVTERKDS